MRVTQISSAVALIAMCSPAVSGQDYLVSQGLPTSAYSASGSYTTYLPESAFEGEGIGRINRVSPGDRGYRLVRMRPIRMFCEV